MLTLPQDIYRAYAATASALEMPTATLITTLLEAICPAVNLEGLNEEELERQLGRALLSLIVQAREAKEAKRD